ncbi:DUF2157 domain-containing protein [Pseudomonas nitroreducens]|uniref:DUF2157 domain-containing protein n=1 Tax=Pseudomonas nitroreducens TaxID=46680 RepID=UPI00209EB8EE|nr:DUF2157 domain-containing protein [Pseudomonas nitroreducens]MCP1623114.1 hypothetical protein [Pseudomonas nitroreducens]
MSLKITADDLRRAVTDGILQPGQDQTLLDWLSREPTTRGDLNLANTAYYFGALLVMGALGWLLTDAWMSVGDVALLSISLIYMLLFTLTGRSLWSRGLRIPGGLLGAVAVSLTPLVVFAIERMTGLWPMDDTQTSYHDYYQWVQGGFLAMEVATVLVGLLMLRLLPFPFVMLPIAIALWFMSMDLCGVLYPDGFTWYVRYEISLYFGLVLLLTSLLIDGRTRQDFAFWGYLVGLLAFCGGLSQLDNGSQWGGAIYCLINLGLMALAVALRRTVFMVFGGIGIWGYLGYLSYSVFQDSLMFPIILTLLGLALIALGIAYSKLRELLTSNLRSGLPDSLLRYIPALRH